MGFWGYNKALALERFQEMMQNAGLPMPKCPEKAIKRWGEQLKKQQNVRGGQHRSGRKPKLSSEQVNQLIKQLLGWREAGLYCSLCQHSAVLCGQPHSKANQRLHQGQGQRLSIDS